MKMIDYKTNTTEIDVILKQIEFERCIASIVNPNLDQEEMIDYITYLDWARENKDEREKIYKKILITEGTLNHLHELKKSSTNADAIRYISEQINVQTVKYNELQAESKQLLNEFFGNK